MKEKLEKKIQESSLLSPEDKNRWGFFISLLDELSLQNVWEAIQDESDLLFLTKNLKEKQDAIVANDPNAWKKIIVEESRYFSSVPKSEL